MQQSIVSVVLAVTPEHVQPLRDTIQALRDRLGGVGDKFPSFRACLPTLHFLSMVVFDSTAGVPAGGQPVTPLFVLEANVDGLPGPFWAALEALLQDDLRDILRLCTSPLGAADILFASVTSPGSRAPIAPLLDQHSVFPAAGHIGNRGLSCRRTLCHDALFRAAQNHLPPPAGVLAGGPVAIHDWLRQTLRPDFDWLDEPFPVAIPAADKTANALKLGLVLVVALVAACLPWLLLAAVIHPAAACVLALLAGAAALTQLHDIGNLATFLGRPKNPQAGRAPYPNAWAVLAAVLIVLAVLRTLHITSHGLWAKLGLLAAGLIASLLLLLAALRQRERADPNPPDSVPDPKLVQELHSWEDCHFGGPDHMASVVIIKPGAFRAFLLRAGMGVLYAVVRVTATDGYLGSMRTIHFAHWGIVDGGKRLVFFSNFDGSWESYLDDFIEKAHAGLTLAWGNCVGFPPAEYLSLKGATQGRKFKAWARCSMTPSRFWYAAYPTLTVNQIVRQAAVAKGLCSASLSPDEAATWVKGL